MPVVRAEGLKMGNLEAASAAACKVELFLYRVDESRKIGADVAGVDAAVLCRNVAKALQFVGWRAGAGRVHEASGEADGPGGERFGEQAFHGAQFGFGESALPVACDGDAERTVADQRSHIGGAAFFDGAKVGFGGGPAPGVVSAEDSVGEGAKLGGIARRRIG